MVCYPGWALASSAVAYAVHRYEISVKHVRFSVKHVILTKSADPMP